MTDDDKEWKEPGFLKHLVQVKVFQKTGSLLDGTRTPDESSQIMGKSESISFFVDQINSGKGEALPPKGR